MTRKSYYNPILKIKHLFKLHKNKLDECKSIIACFCKTTHLYVNRKIFFKYLYTKFLRPYLNPKRVVVEIK